MPLYEVEVTHRFKVWAEDEKSAEEVAKDISPWEDGATPETLATKLDLQAEAKKSPGQLPWGRDDDKTLADLAEVE